MDEKFDIHDTNNQASQNLQCIVGPSLSYTVSMILEPWQQVSEKLADLIIRSLTWLETGGLKEIEQRVEKWAEDQAAKADGTSTKELAEMVIKLNRAGNTDRAIKICEKVVGR